MVEGPFKDDNDPDWEDVKTCDLAFTMQDVNFERSGTTKRDRELFIDVINPSRARRGEVLRIRSRTLHPSFLKFYKYYWARRLAPFKTIGELAVEVNARRTTDRLECKKDPGTEEWD